MKTSISHPDNHIDGIEGQNNRAAIQMSHDALLAVLDGKHKA